MIAVDVIFGNVALSSRKCEFTRVNDCIERRERVFIKVLSLSRMVFSGKGSPVRARCLLDSLKSASSVSLYDEVQERELSFWVRSCQRASMSSSSCMRDLTVFHSA